METIDQKDLKADIYKKQLILNRFLPNKIVVAAFLGSLALSQAAKATDALLHEQLHQPTIVKTVKEVNPEIEKFENDWNSVSNKQETTNQYNSQELGKVRIITDGKTNLPTEYILPDGQIINVDQQQAAAVREKAIETGQYQLLSFTATFKESPAQFISSTSQVSEEHAPVFEKPKRTLSSQDLEKRGIKIIQGKFTQMDIKESAFQENGIFNTYAPTGEKKMIITLVESSAFFKQLLDNPEYSRIKDNSPEFPKETIDEIRERIVTQYKEMAEKNLIMLKNAKDNTTEKFLGQITASTLLEVDLFRSLPEKYIIQIGLLKNGPHGSFEDLISKDVLRESRTVGLYFNIGPDESEIFNLVPYNTTIYGFGVYCDSKGNFHSQQISIPISYDYTSDAPNHPDTYKPKEGYYPGQVMEHEAGHAFVKDNKNKPASSILNPTSDPESLSSDINALPNEGQTAEVLADSVSKKNIAKAWKQFKDSGFTDNSNYPFVFTVQGREGFGGSFNDATGNHPIEGKKVYIEADASLKV